MPKAAYNINVGALMAVIAVWMIGNVGLFYSVQNRLEITVNEAWERAVNMDRRMRLINVKKASVSDITETDNNRQAIVTVSPDSTVFTFSKESSTKPNCEVEKENRTIQSALYTLNPINVNHIDSLFNQFLAQKQIHVSTLVTYFQEKTKMTHTSVGEKLISKTSFATTPVVTGVDDSIILQGYAELTILTNIEYGHNIYIVWFAIEIISIIILALSVYGKKIKQKILGHEKLLAQAEIEKMDIVFSFNDRKIVMNEEHTTLTPLQSLFFYYLATGDNYFRDYKSIMIYLWRDEFVDRRKIDQLKRNMQERLKNITDIKIVRIPYSGYQLNLTDHVQLVLTDIPAVEQS